MGETSALFVGKSQVSQREGALLFCRLQLAGSATGTWKLAIAAQPETMGKGTNADATKIPRLYHLDQEIGSRPMFRTSIRKWWLNFKN